MLIKGDARFLPLRDGCVDCCVSSPPYFGLRDYGNAGQIGLEPTPDAYVAVLVAVYREVRRVLKPEGVVWLNVGDAYASDETLLGVPWLLAQALRVDGWRVESEVIWSKPIGAPAGGARRPLRSHENVFLLSQARAYYYDADAIREPLAEATIERYRYSVKSIRSRVNGGSARKMLIPNDRGRHRRSVWLVTPTHARDDGDHFATMPEKLVEPCILAGCPMGGLVLDPFVGSGTVVAVAERLGRRGVGVDLSYQDLAKRRTAQRGLRFAEVS
jgi:DNA modification methylase